jgi:hypothetical protein
MEPVIHNDPGDETPEFMTPCSVEDMEIEEDYRTNDAFDVSGCIKDPEAYENELRASCLDCKPGEIHTRKSDNVYRV